MKIKPDTSELTIQNSKFRIVNCALSIEDVLLIEDWLWVKVVEGAEFIID